MRLLTFFMAGSLYLRRSSYQTDPETILLILSQSKHLV